MTRHNDARFHAGRFLNLVGHAVADGGVILRGALLHALLFLHHRFLQIHRAFGHADNAELSLFFGAFFHRLNNLFDIIGDFGQ